MKRAAQRRTRYLNDLLIGLCVVAAGIAAVNGDQKSASAFVVAALLNIWVSWHHEKKTGTFAYRLKELVLPGRVFPYERTFASPLRRELKDRVYRAAIGGIILELILLLVSVEAGFTSDTLLAFGLAILAALLPVGLLYELLAVMTYAAATKASAIAAKVIRCALSDNLAELLLIVISVFGMLAWHIPLAINAVQILFINAILMAMPYAAVAWDTKPPSAKAHQGSAKLLSFGIAVSFLAYANFLLFFARNALSPKHVDLHNPYLFKASSLALVTLVLCQILNLFLVRADEHDSFFTNYLNSNRKLLYAVSASLFMLLNLLYNPLVRPYFSTGPLSVFDWLAAIAAACTYLGFRILQRHTRKHTRHAVLALHLAQRN
ncbi:MAG TPA: cation transporting ATPase C-terminal domain-containing protein [Candidatus Saccharimonadales bacterium]|nr:cation transporting ATPase C-terminal domain-containing protein [Candidatus Saccharimonadales bacterium]